MDQFASISYSSYLFHYIQQASAITRNVTVFRLQTIVENSCRSEGHCPLSEMTIDVRKRNEDRRTAVSSNSKYCYELLQVYEFAVVETPRCSRVEINSLRLRRSGLDSQLQ